MKSIRKMEHLLDAHRSNIILVMLLMTLVLYAVGCNKMDPEVPATEVYSNAVQAEKIPDWAPPETSPEVRYYFIPEIDVYYDAYVGEYVYWNGTIWVYSHRLPPAYAEFDLYDANIVFLSVGVVSPWLRHDYYVAHYPVTYFYEPHYVNYGHGWRVYDENRGQFYVTHTKVHHNIHYHGGKHAHGWGHYDGGYHHKGHYPGGKPSHGWGYYGGKGDYKGGKENYKGGYPKGWGHYGHPQGGKGDYKGGQPEGFKGYPNGKNMRHQPPGGPGYREPQNPQPGKPAVKYNPDSRGKEIFKEPGGKQVLKQPEPRHAPQALPPRGGQRQIGSPPRPTHHAPQMNQPKPTRQSGSPGQGQSGFNPKGGPGGKQR